MLTPTSELLRTCGRRLRAYPQMRSHSLCIVVESNVHVQRSVTSVGPKASIIFGLVDDCTEGLRSQVDVVLCNIKQPYTGLSVEQRKDISEVLAAFPEYFLFILKLLSQSRSPSYSSFLVQLERVPIFPELTLL